MAEKPLGERPQQQWLAAWDETVATAPAKGLTAIHTAQTVAEVQRQSLVIRVRAVQSDCPKGAARSDRSTSSTSVGQSPTSGVIPILDP